MGLAPEQVQVGDGRRTRKAGSVWCAGLVQAARSQCHREQSCTELFVFRWDDQLTDATD